jgi:hypothetical protein
MKNPYRALIALAALVFAQMACNLPTRGGDVEATQLPAPNQTLTALFAITPVVSTSTSTLPPVLTSTPEESGGGINPTATQAQPAATNTTAPQPTAVVPTVAITQIQATAAPTNTRPPAQATAVQATATQRPLGRGTVFQAKFLSTPPTIDGDWSEWKSLTTEFSANHVTYGGAARANDDDLAGSFHVGWDATNLYLAVKVRDDRYVQNATGENIYLGDHIEILLDTNLLDDYYYSQLSPDDFQLGINPGRPDPSGTREAYLWFPSNIAGPRSFTIASRLEAGVYRVEAAIPWTVFETTAAVGKRFGFVLSASDNDNTGENLQQSLVSSSPGRRLADPTTWGELQLTN